jgi:hypothetical protein
MTAYPGSGPSSQGRTELWSLRDDVRVETEPGHGPVRLRSRWGEVTLPGATRHVREALHRMCMGPISLGNVVDGRPGDRACALTHLHQVLDRLQPLVIRTLGLETGQPLLSVVPITARARFRPVSLAPDVYVRLSYFARLRTNGNMYVVESPLAQHRVLLHRLEAVCMIGGIGGFATVAGVAAAAGQPEAIVADALAYLSAARIAIVADTADGDRPAGIEEPETALAGWLPGDLMFHTRSTLGRCQEPVVRPRRPGTPISLHRPLSVALADRASP